jgi:protein TonB
MNTPRRGRLSTLDTDGEVSFMSRKPTSLAGLGLLFLAALASVSIARAAGDFQPPKLKASCFVQPVYPQSEKEAGIEGTVLLEVKVLADGTIGKIGPKEEIAGHPSFTAAAVAAVQKWCFEPGLKDGRPVAMEIAIPIRFALEKKEK